jgi:hypothetical protein
MEETGKGKTRNEKAETRNWKAEIRKWKIEIREERARCSGCCPESAISCPY